MLLAHIRERFRLSRETYGSPRMHADLMEDSIIAGARVARLMRYNDLKARQKRHFKKTTDSDHGGPIAPNHLDQDFAATESDQKWAADISCIWTAVGWPLSRHCSRPFLTPYCRMGGQRPAEKRSGAFRLAAGARFAPPRGGDICITLIVRVSGLVAAGRPDPHSDRPFGRLAPQGVPEWPDPHSDRPRSVSFPGPVGRPGAPCGEVLPRRCM